MKPILTIITILLCAAICYAQQFDFANENGTHPVNFPDAEKLIAKTQGNIRGNDVEFRLFRSVALINNLEFFVMRYSNGSWNACVYRMGQDRKWNATRLDAQGLDSLWSVLEFNKVLTLPDQETIRNRMVTFPTGVEIDKLGLDNSIRVAVMDGVSYQFQLRHGSRRRAYSYQNPGAYLARNPNVEELYRADAIVRLVEDYIKRNEIK